MYYAKRMPIRIIAKSLGVTYAMIWQRLMRLGILKRKGNRRLSLAGRRFGKLKVIKLQRVSKKRASTFWLAVCKCGDSTVVRGSALTSGAVRSCGCTSRRRGKLNHGWKGAGLISGSMWNKITDCASARNIPVRVSIGYCWKLFLRQNGKCALSGLPIKISASSEEHFNGMTTASLDRKDSSKGYVRGNLQWTHKMVNRMKWGLTVNQFVGLCKSVARYNK